jgi:hypothetical protein
VGGGGSSIKKRVYEGKRGGGEVGRREGSLKCTKCLGVVGGGLSGTRVNLSKKIGKRRGGTLHDDWPLPSPPHFPVQLQPGVSANRIRRKGRIKGSKEALGPLYTDNQMMIPASFARYLRYGHAILAEGFPLRLHVTVVSASSLPVEGKVYRSHKITREKP